MNGLATICLEGRRIEVRQTWEDEGRSIKAYPKDGEHGCCAVRIPSRLLRELQAIKPQSWNEPCGQTHADGKLCRSRLVLVGPLRAPLNDKNMR